MDSLTKGNRKASGSIADLLRLLRVVPAEQVDHLLRRLSELHGEIPTQAPIARQSRLRKEFRLSYFQEHQWFFAQLEPGSCLFNIPAAAHIVGKLDTVVLERCVHEIISRHEILRTSFKVVAGQPVQAIQAEITLPRFQPQVIPVENWKRRVKEITEREVKRPFDFSQAPLLRSRLIRLNEREHIVLFVFHHIVFDSWSMGILLREIATLYEAFCAAETPALPPLPIQYADFSVWQRQRLEGEISDRLLEYWGHQLAGTPPTLELPTDRQRPAVPTSHGALLRSTLPKTSIKALSKLAKEEGATLFMVLLAAFNVLLHRYTDQEDICVGTPVAGRTRAELQGLIGMFVNTVALRTRLWGSLTFRGLLQRTRETTLAAFAHQEMPFGKLVAELKPERTRTQQPFFNVAFVFENAPMPPLEFSGMLLKPIYPYRGLLPHDLILTVVARDRTLFWEYKLDLFTEASVRGMQRHFEHLLESIAETPNAAISKLEMVARNETQRWIETFSDELDTRK